MLVTVLWRQLQLRAFLAVAYCKPFAPAVRGIVLFTGIILTLVDALVRKTVEDASYRKFAVELMVSRNLDGYISFFPVDRKYLPDTA